ncbi:MAG: hypothetical protein V3V08_04220 [Nannocystaceae bacterium]
MTLHAQTLPVRTLHFEPRGLSLPRSEVAVAHWRRTATLPAHALEALTVTTELAEVRIYIVSEAETIEVVCEYMATECPVDTERSGIHCELFANGTEARLNVHASSEEEQGWLRVYLTVPDTVGVQFSERTDDAAL